MPIWRPMHTAPQAVARIWLNHLTLGPILAEGRPGRWYAPSATRQMWRWYRPAEPGALEPFAGWLPYEALAAGAAPRPTTPDGAGRPVPIPPARRPQPAPSP